MCISLFHDVNDDIDNDDDDDDGNRHNTNQKLIKFQKVCNEYSTIFEKLLCSFVDAKDDLHHTKLIIFKGQCFVEIKIILFGLVWGVLCCVVWCVQVNF